MWYWVPTKKVKPSQTCHQCGRQEKKPLSLRWHSCGCGANCSREEESGSARTPPKPSSGSVWLGLGYGENAARVMLKWALASLVQKEVEKGLESSPAGSQGDGAQGLVVVVHSNVRPQNRKRPQSSSRKARALSLFCLTLSSRCFIVWVTTELCAFPKTPQAPTQGVI